jgi:hypothetical protein
MDTADLKGEALSAIRLASARRGRAPIARPFAWIDFGDSLQAPR